MPKTAEVWCIW